MLWPMLLESTELIGFEYVCAVCLLGNVMAVERRPSGLSVNPNEFDGPFAFFGHRV